MERGLLLKRFLKNPSQIGALCPSSPALCREITSQIGLENARGAVELGPGTGVITREILKTLPETAGFVAVELDEELCKIFAAEFPSVKLCNRSAEDLPEIVKEIPALTHVDAVLSGLPWAAFPADLQERILSAVVETLSDGGYFTTFAYLQGLLLPAGIRFRRRLHAYFAQVEISRVVWRNMPPAIIYRCRKLSNQ